MKTRIPTDTFLQQKVEELCDALRCEKPHAVEALLHNPHLPEFIDELGKDGNNALHTSARLNRIDLVERVLAAGADPMVENRNGLIAAEITDFESIAEHLARANEAFEQRHPDKMGLHV
jgi:ankyrin repeat protein